MKRRTRERKEITMLKLSSLILKKLQNGWIDMSVRTCVTFRSQETLADISYLWDIHIPTD
jgi:hypothetical protein